MRGFLPIVLFTASILTISTPATAMTEPQAIPVVKLKTAPLTDDLGEEPYEAKRYFKKQQALMPKYTPDVRFELNSAVKGAIAVFDHDDNERHYISQTLLFQF